MTDPGADHARPIVLCPLEFERQSLEQAGLDAHCDLHCIGPGGENVRQWARSVARPAGPVLLAGLAGSLTPSCGAGSAHVIAEVVEESGEDRWRPTLNWHLDRRSSSDVEEVVITSTQAPVTGRLARQIINRETGGMLIDLESVAFATTASKMNWDEWGIVRGVSDDLATLLPEGLDEWVSELGRTRWSQVMRSLLLRPQLIPRILELREHSTAAMEAVAELIRRWLAVRPR